jgi:hypothetical protein
MASKIGPDLESHPKIRYAWSLHHASLGLHLLGLSFAQRTGGFVSLAFVHEKIPVRRERTMALAALTAVAPGEEHPMWSAVEGGWQIHNFDRHAEFRTAEQAQAISDARAEAGRRGAAKRWENQGKSPSKPNSNLPIAKEDLPDFAISDKERKALTALKGRGELLSLCHRLAMAIRHNDPNAQVAPEGKRWLDAARLLLDRDGRTVEDVERVIDWCQQDEFWRSNVLSMPTLREKFTQLWLKMQERPATAGGRRESPSELLRAIEEAA